MILLSGSHVDDSLCFQLVGRPTCLDRYPGHPMLGSHYIFLVPMSDHRGSSVQFFFFFLLGFYSIIITPVQAPFSGLRDSPRKECKFEARDMNFASSFSPLVSSIRSGLHVGPSQQC